MGMDLTAARYPFSGGGYESFYLKAHHPSERLAIWIRCTVTQSPGGPPRGQRWVTLFSPEGITKIRTEGDLTDNGSWITVGDASFTDGICGGTAEDAIWQLRFTPLERPLLYLPSERMYRGALPKAKPVSLSPHARFDGTLRIGDRRIEMRDWRGMVGHNWGSAHADRWIWLHGIFRDDTWIDVVAARVKLGPVTTPWIASGAISLDGTRHRLGGMSRTRKTTVDPGTDGALLELPGDAIRVHARVDANPSSFVAWDYEQPAGGTSDVRNCSIADLEVSFELGTGSTQHMQIEGRAAYEYGQHA